MQACFTQPLILCAFYQEKALRKENKKQKPVTDWADYYPFGAKMPGRNLEADYLFSHQGKEEAEGQEWLQFELRMYNPSTGRFNSTDPYGQYHSPYLAMGNNPISFVDPDGGWAVPSWGVRMNIYFDAIELMLKINFVPLADEYIDSPNPWLFFQEGGYMVDGLIVNNKVGQFLMEVNNRTTIDENGDEIRTHDIIMSVDYPWVQHDYSYLEIGSAYYTAKVLAAKHDLLEAIEEAIEEVDRNTAIARSEVNRGLRMSGFGDQNIYDEQTHSFSEFTTASIGMGPIGQGSYTVSGSISISNNILTVNQDENGTVTFEDMYSPHADIFVEGYTLADFNGGDVTWSGAIGIYSDGEGFIAEWFEVPDGTSNSGEHWTTMNLSTIQLPTSGYVEIIIHAGYSLSLGGINGGGVPTPEAIDYRYFPTYEIINLYKEYNH